MTTTTNDLARSLGPASLKRSDPLAQFTPSPGTPTDLRGAARTFFAFCLLAAGIGVAAWLIVMIHAAIFEPRRLGIFERIASSKPQDLTITLPAGPVTLAPGVMALLGYVVLFLLGWVAAKIVTLMIEQGATLLRERKAEVADHPPTVPPPPPPPRSPT